MNCAVCWKCVALFKSNTFIPEIKYGHQTWRRRRFKNSYSPMTVSLESKYGNHPSVLVLGDLNPNSRPINSKYIVAYTSIARQRPRNKRAQYATGK
jgi:hypothetical protein